MSLMIVDQLMLYPCQTSTETGTTSSTDIGSTDNGTSTDNGLNQYQKRDPTSTKNGTLTYQ